ncbi:sulfotransferase 1C4 [Hyalella azteca]|uniref:Sulfotransferase 1C4 n=1 Tax=Hyalella azteca TaxID=294128 RepID=A0A8B7N0J1_HYAAZ|nr:sulfotransferase 1C4 [Hyalella azteca]
MSSKIKLSGGRYAEELPGALMQRYVQDFTGTMGPMLRIEPSGTIVTHDYKHFIDEIYNFKFRPDDVLVMTYPKCGTTWCQEIVWNMRNNPNLDHPNPEEPLLSRSPFIEADMLTFGTMQQMPFDTFLSDAMFTNFRSRCPNLDSKRGIHLQVAESQKEPRTLKTHLPFSCFAPGLLDKCKVVFVIRHPKDVVLSYQHHCRLIMSHGFTGTQDVFIKYFVDNLLLWGSYGNMVREVMQYKTHPNLHVMFYEVMKADIAAELRKLNTFLGTGLSEGQLRNVQKQTSFNNMQRFDPMRMMSSVMCNKDVAQNDGAFIRNGVSGAWKGKLTAEQEKLLDDYIAENFLDPELRARFL